MGLCPYGLVYSYIFHLNIYYDELHSIFTSNLLMCNKVYLIYESNNNR